MRLRTPFEKDEVFVVVGVMGVVILVGVSVSFSGDFVLCNAAVKLVVSKHVIRGLFLHTMYMLLCCFD